MLSALCTGFQTNLKRIFMTYIAVNGSSPTYISGLNQEIDLQ